MKKTGLLLALFLTASFGLSACTGIKGTAGETPVEPPDYRSFLKIDVHTHIFADFPEYVKMMRRNNVKGINICTGGTDPEMIKLEQEIAEKVQAAYPDTFGFASTFDLTTRDQEDYAEQTDKWLTSCVASGALMIKIWKDIGMDMIPFLIMDKIINQQNFIQILNLQ
jgi:hypothetical protein